MVSSTNSYLLNNNLYEISKFQNKLNIVNFVINLNLTKLDKSESILKQSTSLLDYIDKLEKIVIFS